MTDVSRKLVQIFFATTQLKKDMGVANPPPPLEVRRLGSRRRRLHGRGNRRHGRRAGRRGRAHEGRGIAPGVPKGSRQRERFWTIA